MSTRKLLLADDSITIQKVVNLTFADEGIEVIAVGSGDAAMEKLAEVAPDLVMADINMPGLTGYQVCERIKQDENFKNTPVILLVGSFEPFNEDEARRVGADDFLTKPFQSIRQLVSKVSVLLDANDRSAAQVYEATAHNSFADTLEMNESEITGSDKADDLGDAGMDDEMIQSAPINNFALDESAKFETKDFVSDEDAEDHKRTQPLSVYDLKDFDFVASSPEKENESQTSESAGREEFAAPEFPGNAAAGESESTDSVENDSDESGSQTPNSDEIQAAESQPEARDFYESVLEESDVDVRRKEDFSSFLDSADDDLLEIPFDEDEEWETEETADAAQNDSTGLGESNSAAENEQNPSVENENQADEQFEENQTIEESAENPSAEREEQFSGQNESLIEELPQPGSLDETSERTTDESEETASPETDETARTKDFDEEISSNEFSSAFQPKSGEEGEQSFSSESGSENPSPEITGEALQNEDESRSEYGAPEEDYRGENEIVVGTLIEPDNQANETANGEEKPENQSITDANGQFSPELIDAVARRVVELLSDKVVREIAWEVVPQHADLVIKKAVEEKLAGEKPED